MNRKPDTVLLFLRLQVEKPCLETLVEQVTLPRFTISKNVFFVENRYLLFLREIDRHSITLAFNPKTAADVRSVLIMAHLIVVLFHLTRPRRTTSCPWRSTANS